MNPLLRKRSINSKDLWLSDFNDGCSIESPEISNETAIATLCLGSVKSPLSGSFSVDYLCKYLATSPKADFFSDIEENSNDSEVTSLSPGTPLSSRNCSDVSLPSLQDDSSFQGGVFFGNDAEASGYISFPRIEENSLEERVKDASVSSFNRSIIDSLSGTLRKRSASV
ncbi:hypothetical protein K493DRAFT_319556 [Basidiobolus meristosporus CBS 931.73]|uniref:Uncharacterized protein n=1 Tax=Basidiobolus meristosporus CBS 931.73 TaxID=1314790 RepID=A0A1Y1XQZ3_9FUNG|nr:hypothetical protein K493DRAFT_319556 [Basidiobolus meristosporus CBS 931.73]|eukprot:ORX88172.1 hypothetical protein K493DRAFT_319556 [Basidiobolus meristosporus CBS 931.73]